LEIRWDIDDDEDDVEILGDDVDVEEYVTGCCCTTATFGLS
jgi:hypothetical protein